MVRRFAMDTKGGIAIIMFLALPVMLGALGLGIELGMWYLEKRRIQEAADSGALQGAFAFRANPDISDTDLTAAAKTAVARSGYPDAKVSGIAVERPPLRGGFTTDETAVEVTVDVDHQAYFIAWFGFSSIPIQARAVAMQGAAPSDACVLALGDYCTASTPNSSSPIIISGNATLNLEECGIHANGQCPTGINGQGSSILGATCVTANTQVDFDNYCGPSTDADGNPIPLVDCGAGGDVYANCGEPAGGMGTITDPFAYLTLPTAASPCSSTLPNIGTTSIGGVSYKNVNPGCYDINAPINSDVLLAPGVYWFDGGIKFHGKIRGTGVILVVTGDPGNIEINANNGVEISAPTHDDLVANTGGVYNGFLGDTCCDPNDPDGDPPVPDGIKDWANMLIYNDTAGTNSCSKINGTSDNVFSGAIYMPDACVVFNGDATVAPGATCLMLVANQITVNGNAGFSTAGCGAQSNSFQTARAVGLVE